MPKLNIEDLNSLYEEAKTADREAVAEMRSNILLIAGDHYTKRMTEWWNRARSNNQVNDNVKLRITKNWLHRAHLLYVSSITSQAPGATISPANPTELKDQKQAELNKSVWEYAKHKYKLKAHIRNGAGDFCGIGEVCTIIKFDPTRGSIKGYEPTVDPEGFVLVDEMGQPVPDMEKPVMTGEFIFERVYGHQLFRDPCAKQMKDSKFMGVEILESTKSLRAKYQNDEQKLKMITESSEEYVVFDSNRSGYSKEKNQTCVRYFYYRPCHEYPNGYFYICTKEGILEEGELPGGIFPVVWQGFDEHPTKPRATSMVKVARPWQAEINRAASQIALHQVTISEDKVLYQAGAKLAQGALLPGVRGIQYQGQAPQILPGRSGEQYFEYVAMQQAEMDKALLLDQLDQEKLNNLDPVALLFRTMSQSQKFSPYVEKFGEYLVELCEVFLDLAKFYLPDDELIAAIGKSEAINIAEFRDTSPLCYKIHVEEANETIESKLGKQLMFNHILQYVGTQLSREDIGKMIVNMPYGNRLEDFEDFTQDNRNVKNDFLAIERGETPAISPKDKSDYCLAQVARRKKERDYRMLDPSVQALYDQYEQFHMDKMAQEAAAMKAAQSEFIPTGGAMIACDMYLPAEDPSKAPKRARIPYQALDWLVKTLEQQGMSLDVMEGLNEAQMAEIAQNFTGGGAAQPNSAALMGQASPNGAIQ